MDFILKLIVGLFLFSIFGGFVNDVFYYTFAFWKYIMEVAYFVFSFLGLSALGIVLMNLLYYLPIMGMVYFIVTHTILAK